MQVFLLLENRQYDFPVPNRFPDGFCPVSIAKVCPFCLRNWAIVKATSAQFSIQATCCLACWTPDRHKILPNHSPVAGSLLDDCGRMGVQWPLLDYFPKALLEREFLIHLKVIA